MNDKIVNLCKLIYELTNKQEFCTEPSHYLVRKQVNSTIYLRNGYHITMCKYNASIRRKNKNCDLINIENKAYDKDIIYVPNISDKQLYSICLSVYNELQERIYI